MNSMSRPRLATAAATTRMRRRDPGKQHLNRPAPATIDRYAVIGNPIEQSKSPQIHAEFARRTGEQLEYVKILGPAGGFAAAADGFRATGGKGLNVTAPFKLDAFAYARERSASATLAGAVNALKFTDDGAIGENFDGVGLVRDVVRNLGQPLAGRRVLLLGAGGAARGVLLPFIAERPSELTIVHFHAGEAGELAGTARSHAGRQTRVRTSDYHALAGSTFDLVFNATSASLHNELPPVPATVFEGCRLAYDLTYGKGLNPFLRLAANAGVAQVADGVGMLVEQAAEAFAWWRGVRPETAGVIEQLRVPLA